MIGKLVLSGAVSALMIGGVQAADIDSPASYDWSGAYVGLQAGYGWGDSHFDLTQGGDVTVARDYDQDGFVGGVHAGYNFAMQSLLLGLEGDLEYADIQGDGELPDPSRVADKSIEWLASLRLRAGVAMDRALFYATGGLAVGEVHMELSNNIGSPDRDTAWGWTIGGGVEYALSDAISARIEYRYTDLENTDHTGNIDGPFTVEHENDFHAIRAGLSWHFDSM